ncbi:site-specific DNA-methyltransferase [Ochrobactrum tritici]|uniref:site-specific DNA-methyltransferase (adenine-specific) n=1 Tax=Brucella tritici TaxID=94626 RepID=A0A7X6JA47_9HYPH|nr:site-specific DNA-methyltransferase [Brucella tritici]
MENCGPQLWRRMSFWGTGAINVGACKIPAEKVTGWGGSAGGSRTNVCSPGDKSGTPRPSEGRFPANILHDGSPEVLAAFPVVESGKPAGTKQGGNNNVFGQYGGGIAITGFGDEGSAARFFYSAKADHDDRLGSKHPTVKPVDVMRWLVRLVCRKGGLILDPFAGTGTTGAAAYWEGCDAVLVEWEEEYQGDIERRMKLILAGPDERKRARTVAEPANGLPLFRPFD